MLRRTATAAATRSRQQAFKSGSLAREMPRLLRGAAALDLHHASFARNHYPMTLIALHRLANTAGPASAAHVEAILGHYCATICGPNQTQQDLKLANSAPLSPSVMRKQLGNWDAETAFSRTYNGAQPPSGEDTRSALLRAAFEPSGGAPSLVPHVGSAAFHGLLRLGPWLEPDSVLPRSWLGPEAENVRHSEVAIGLGTMAAFASKLRVLNFATELTPKDSGLGKFRLNALVKRLAEQGNRVAPSWRPTDNIDGRALQLVWGLDSAVPRFCPFQLPHFADAAVVLYETHHHFSSLHGVTSARQMCVLDAFLARTECVSPATRTALTTHYLVRLAAVVATVDAQLSFGRRNAAPRRRLDAFWAARTGQAVGLRRRVDRFFPTCGPCWVPATAAASDAQTILATVAAKMPHLTRSNLEHTLKVCEALLHWPDKMGISSLRRRLIGRELLEPAPYF